MAEDVLTAFLHRIELWPFLEVSAKMGLAVAVGTLVGLEREHRGKAGVRTFALTSLLGAMGGMLGPPYGPFAMLFVVVFVVLMNWREMERERKLALTTSVALCVVAFAGVMCGLGHVFTPAAACIATAILLAWKERISGFAGTISDQEIRSALLLAVLAFVVYPLLPEDPVDPWGLVDPRPNWVAVIAIAAIGFTNYVLLKALGPRGMEITAFFGGLVNSRKVIVELMGRVRDGGSELAATAQRGVTLATGSMVIRNALIVAIFAPVALPLCGAALLLMLVTSAVLWWRAYRGVPEGPVPALTLESPFRLSAALKFGLVFLALNVMGGLAEQRLGTASFYGVSVLGGLLSSASSITSAATLVRSHQIPVSTGANGIVLSSITSVLANVPFVRAMSPDRSVRRSIILSLALIAAGGGVGAVLGLVWLDGAAG